MNEFIINTVVYDFVNCLFFNEFGATYIFYKSATYIYVS